MSLLSSVGCALRPRAHDLRNRLRRSAGTLSPIPQGRRRSHVTSARSRLRSDPGGYAGSRPARGRWARDAGGALAGWPPARLDRPSGREDLAGVLEEDHPVAQQAPALVRVRPHHARGVPVWCVRRRADGLVLALATGAGDGAAARRVVTRRRGGAVDRGWGDHGVASGGARPRRLLRKTHLHGQQTLRLPVTAVTTTCCLRARRVCMGSFKLPRSRTDRGGRMSRTVRGYLKASPNRLRSVANGGTTAKVAGARPSWPDVGDPTGRLLAPPLGRGARPTPPRGPNCRRRRGFSPPARRGSWTSGDSRARDATGVSATSRAHD